MSTLLVAAGGGGDAIGAAMIAAGPEVLNDGVCGIATFSWDRLLIDPRPGPRAAEDFAGLGRPADHVHIVTAASRPIPPAGSTLPRLAGSMPEERLFLLDPSGGGEGLHKQIRSAASHLGADRVLLVDVGGDIIARGDEPELKSPLADGLAAAACMGLDIPVEVAVAGPGLDGELTADRVRTALRQAGGRKATVLGPAHARRAASALDWHPSEVSGLLAAAADGIRGVVEIRDGGTPIELDDRSAEVWLVPLQALINRSMLIAPLAATGTLTAAETILRDVCGRSEIDYERAKASALDTLRSSPRGPFTLDAFERAVHDIQSTAAARGVDYLTLRRLIELAGGTAANHDRLRAHLKRRWPERYRAPLWRIGL